MSFRIALQGALGRLNFDVTFETAANTVVVVGPNGAGKTTLLRAVAGAVLPIAGSVVVADRSLMNSNPGPNTPPAERRVGYLPQRLALFPHLTVAQNVAFGARAQGMPSAQARALARDVLNQLEAASLAPLYPHNLSVGESQRVALARALAADAKVLLLDEPLAALDLGARRSARRFLVDHFRRPDLCTIVVTHDPHDVWAFAGQDGCVVQLQGGRVVRQGTVTDLAKDPSTPFLQELLQPPSPI